MVDDAQLVMGDVNFWRALATTDTWLPKTIRFIISTNQAVKDHQTPLLSMFKTIGKDELVLQEHEMATLFSRQVRIPERFKVPELIKVVSFQCRGQILHFRLLVHAMTFWIQGRKTCTIESLIAFVASSECARIVLDHVTDQEPKGPTRDILALCLSGNITTYSPGSRGATELRDLSAAGIIEIATTSAIDFSSPLMKKIAYLWLFAAPTEPSVTPTSLCDLIIRAVTLLSASSLKKSTVNGKHPSEATFQHLFMGSLISLVNVSTFVCPESSLAFTCPSNSGAATVRTSGKLDFYIDGTLQWGIELLVNGSRLGEHLGRFEGGGKYTTLKLNAYAVVDFRSSKDGSLGRGAQRHANLYRVVFRRSDYSACTLFIGDDDKGIPIQLSR